MKIHWRHIVGIGIALLVPSVSSAEVIFTEIMYDLEGSDSKREWVEICNSGSLVNIAGWKFFENGSNHGLRLIDGYGDESLASGEVAIFASDDATFLSDHPSFSGTLFDSVFSLSNSGEVLEIRDADLNTIYSVTYTSESGGAGDGQSLSFINGVWVGATPTPGTVSCVAEAEETATTTQTENMSQSHGSVVLGPPATIRAYAGADRVVVVGASNQFDAVTEGIDGKPLGAQRYQWNFGDGFTAEGDIVFHTFSYPGEYVVFLDVTSGVYSTSDIVYVEVIPADIFISAVEVGLGSGYVEIFNNTEHDIEISRWYIEAEGSMFIIPENTFLRSQQKIRFSNEATGLGTTHSDSVGLLYPSLVVADSFVLSKRGPESWSSRPQNDVGGTNNFTSDGAGAGTIHTYSGSHRVENMALNSSHIPNATELHLENDPEIASDYANEVKDVSENKDEFTNTSQRASVIHADSDGENSFFEAGMLKWFGLFLIIVIGTVTSVVVVGFDNPTPSSMDLMERRIDEFDIEEM